MLHVLLVKDRVGEVPQIALTVFFAHFARVKNMNFGAGQEHNCRRIRLSEFVNLHAFAASFPGQHT
ncbi:hypothetical protein OSL60_28155, partial [Escherichia coli]|nr:hypothetical protein [Escherichia coli]